MNEPIKDVVTKQMHIGQAIIKAVDELDIEPGELFTVSCVIYKAKDSSYVRKLNLVEGDMLVSRQSL